MLSRVVFLTDIGWGCYRGAARGIATFATAHARNAWIPMMAGQDATDVLDDRKNRNIIGAIAIEGRGMDHAIEIGLPTVCISGKTAVCPVPRVRSDDSAIGASAADHLMSAGLRNFAYFGGVSYFSDRRCDGFCLRLRKNGHASAHQLCADTGDEAGAGLREWLVSLAKPVGVLASSDNDAARVIAACRELDLRMPDDVAVVGVDNDDVLCESTYPSLSSIPHEAGNIGYQAAGILMRLIRGDRNIPPLTLIPPGPIVVRGSSDGLFMPDPVVREATAYLRRHFADGIKIQAVADEVCVCRKTLDVRFKAALGRTPADELRRLQISHAQRLLQTSDLAMSQVAHSAGFTAARRFSEAFLRETNLTPTEFRRTHRNCSA